MMKLFRSIIEIVDGKNPDLISLESMQKKVSIKKVESLRTILHFHPHKSNLSVFPSITPLQVLSSNCSKLSALKNFIHLRYFELYESNIVTLPESICSLRKLQTLKLVQCRKLISLPKQLSQLQDLRHLVITRCRSLRSMPSNIGGLTHLRTLSIFIVSSEAGFGLAELHNLQLGGKLRIKGLENVSNERDAREVNLSGKKELSHLYLSWSIDANSQVSVTGAEQVLEALEPHTGLKCFGMNGYLGINIPNWMRNTSILEGLVEVILFYCRNCERLPPLGKLPCLKTLYVLGMRDVKYIDDDLYEGATKKAFPLLKNMTLYDLPNLERVLKAEGVEMLSQLSNLSIEVTPKLEFPSVTSVDTFHAKWNTSNNDGASFLRGIAASMPNLKTLYIEYFSELKVLTNELNSLSSLQQLHISSCNKLESIPECILQGLSSLQGLYLCNCPSLVTLPDWLGTMTSLQTLQIWLCPKLTSLPASFQGLINLHKLHIFGCPMLVDRCKKETGEDWHKIAHVPNLYLHVESTVESSSFYENMMSLWKKTMQFWRYHDDSYLFDIFDYV